VLALATKRAIQELAVISAACGVLVVAHISSSVTFAGDARIRLLHTYTMRSFAGIFKSDFGNNYP
jgi:hypothetical protein